MSPQADFIVSNGTGAAVRSDLNVQFAAIVSNNSGATEPATMYAYQWWADTATGLLKLRNSANSGWVTIRQLDGEFSTVPVENGTAAAPSIFFKDSGTDTGLFSPGADQVAISTGGTSRLAVSTTAVSSTLAVDVPLGAVGTPSITFTGDLNTGIWSPTADTIAFSEGGAEAMRLDASGRLLVGTSSARTVAVYAAGGSQLQVEGTTYQSSSLSLINNQDGTDSSYFVFGKSRGTSTGGVTLVNNNDLLGTLWFTGADGTSLIRGAVIEARVDGTPGTNDMPGRLVFYTTADGASSPTERLRITSTGQVRLAGAGITFNGDTAAANELDDYEEGAFTPSFIGSTGSAGSAATLYPLGAYTKIGNTVTFSFALVISNIGSYTGDLRFTGLPFTTTYGEAQPIAISQASVTQVDLKMIGAQIKDSGDYINLRTGTNLGSNVQVSDVNTGSYFMFGGSYRI
jgi:hypothetical protein